MPIWATAVLSFATLLLGGGGILAWLRYFRTEEKQGEADVISTMADARLKEAQATETIAEAFTNTLAQVRQLAEDRKDENDRLRGDLEETRDTVDTHEGRIKRLAESLATLWHYFSERGEHGRWDQDTVARVRIDDPDWPPPPMPDPPDAVS